MKTLTCLLTVAVVLAISAAVSAQHRQCNVVAAQSSYTKYQPPVSYYYGTSYHQPEVQHRKRIVQIVSVAQINPAYTSAYSPDGYDSATQADILNELRRLGYRLDQVAAIAAKAAAQQVPATVPPTAPPVVPPVSVPAPVPAAPVGPMGVLPKGGQVGGAVGIAVLTAKCAACHQQGKLAPDQRFVLLDVKGNLAPLTDKQKLRVVTKTYSGQMPPPMNIHGIPALTDSEFAGIVDLIQ